MSPSARRATAALHRAASLPGVCGCPPVCTLCSPQSAAWPPPDGGCSPRPYRPVSQPALLLAPAGERSLPTRQHFCKDDPGSASRTGAAHGVAADQLIHADRPVQWCSCSRASGPPASGAGPRRLGERRGPPAEGHPAGGRSAQHRLLAVGEDLTTSRPPVSRTSRDRPAGWTSLALLWAGLPRPSDQPRGLMLVWAVLWSPPQRPGSPCPGPRQPS